MWRGGAGAKVLEIEYYIIIREIFSLISKENNKRKLRHIDEALNYTHIRARTHAHTHNTHTLTHTHTNTHTQKEKIVVGFACFLLVSC